MKAPGGSVRPDIGAARAQGVNEGPLYGLCPPGWPASTLFTPALRSDIARARQANLRLRAGLIYPLFNSLLGACARPNFEGTGDDWRDERS